MAIEDCPVFINYCVGKNVHLNGFVYNIVKALVRNEIKVFIDRDEDRGQGLEVELKRIVKSRIALVIFSGKYTESTNCLAELAKINACVEKGKLVAIPIFYKLHASTVKGLRGQFGDAFRKLREDNETKKKWKEALLSISAEMGITVDKKSPSIEKIIEIVEKVKERLNISTSEESEEAYMDPSENSDIQENDKPLGIKQRLKELGDKLDLNKITSHLGMIIGWLLLLCFCLQQIVYMSTPLIGMDGVINGTKNSSSNAKTNGDYFHNRTCPNPRMDGIVKPPKIQVFINFRGEQLRNNFIGYLVDALQRSEINVFIDNHEQRGEDLNNLFKRIEDSGVAIVVFSSRYTDSKWCLEELVKIKERVHQGLLKVLPIFYKVTPTNVKRLKGEFGDHFRDKEYMYESDEPKIKRWKEAIAFVSHRFALAFHEKSTTLENDFVRSVVEEVLKILQAISTVESDQAADSLVNLCCAENTKLKLKL